MADAELVPVDGAGMTPAEFVRHVTDQVGRRGGELVFKKRVGAHDVVLRIYNNYGWAYNASVSLRQAGSRDDEPGTLKDITVEAGCELYAWIADDADCDTMQKAVVSPNGQALALIALFRLLREREERQCAEAHEYNREIEQ